MDLAYDHIAEEALAKEQAEAQKDGSSSDHQQASLSADLQDAYKALSSSPWGVRIGGFLGNMAKQVSYKG